MSESRAFTISERLSANAETSPTSLAIEDGPTGIQISYEALVSCADTWSRSISSLVPPGSRVGLMMESGTDLSRWLLAVMWRHTVVPLSPSLTPDEVRRYLVLTSTRWLIATEPSAALVHACLAIGTTMLTPQSIIAVPVSEVTAETVVHEDDVAAVLLTSGSTSTPKVVPLTHGNLVAGANQVAHSLRLSAHDRCLVLWAQHHIGGLVDLLLAPLFSGGSIINGGSFSLESFRSLFASSTPTWIQFVPATLDETIRDSARRSLPLTSSTLRFVRCVAAPITSDLWSRAEEAFGCPLVHTYGMTEASPLITSTPLDSSRRVDGSSGRSHGTEIRIADDAGRSVGPGVNGSILLRGPNVFRGYEGDEGAPSVVNGWFRTGDLGHLDAAGELFVLGREANMINRGGEKINPSEVEETLRTHPSVVDAAVFALPHPRLGQIVAAGVSSDSALDPSDVLAFAADRLAPHKVPAHIQVLSDLPRNEVGKIDRLALADLALTAMRPDTRSYQSETEKIVAEIWATELDEADLSPTIPFTVAGGDSLSAVRIVVEVESRFAVIGHSRDLLRAATIRDLAHLVDTLRTDTPTSTVHSSGAVATIWDNSLDLDDFEIGIVAADDPVTCESFQHLALTHLCGHELDTLTRRIRASKPHLLTKESALVRWRDPGQQLLRGSNSYADDHWSRTRLHEWVTLYRRPQVNEAGITLIGFVGLSGRLNLPISCILANVPQPVDAIVLVNDPTRRHFTLGVPGLSDDLATLPRAIADLVPPDCRGDIRTLGISAGGLIAAITALDLGATSYGLVGPDSIRRHDTLHARLVALAGSGSAGRVVVGRTRRDWNAQRDLRSVLPDVRMRRYLPARHPVLYYAWRLGRLRPLLKWLLHE